jgi:hypothetical protein
MATEETRWLNKQKVLARFRRVPEQIRAEVAAALKVEVHELVEAMRRAAPVSDVEQHPGQFRDSIHEYPNPDRPLSYRVIADARDAKGEFIGPHIEYGHTARDGSHVPAVPSFWPTYRARRKAMRRRLANAVRKAARKFKFEGTV